MDTLILLPATLSPSVFLAAYYNKKLNNLCTNNLFSNLLPPYHPLTHNWWMHKMEHRRPAISLSGVHTWRKSFQGPSFCSLHWCLNDKSVLVCDAPPTRTGQVHLPLVRIFFVHPLPILFQAINCCMVQFWNEISLRILILKFHNASFSISWLNWRMAFTSDENICQ